MLSDPRDARAYRIAVASLGAALIVVLVGMCVVAALGTEAPRGRLCRSQSSPIHGTGGYQLTEQLQPKQQEIVCRQAIAGGLQGRVTIEAQSLGQTREQSQLWDLVLVASALGGALLGILASPLDGAPKSRQEISKLALMLLVVVVVVVATVKIHPHRLQVLVAAGGGVLVGMMVPSPIQSEREEMEDSGGG